MPQIQFMRPLINFLQSYSQLSGTIVPLPYFPRVETIEGMQIINVAPFESHIQDGNVLQYLGTTQPVISRDTIGNSWSTRQANFLWQLRKTYSIESYNNESMAELLSSVELWVEEMDLTAKQIRYDELLTEGYFATEPFVPRFGSPDFNERIWADGGMLLDINENPFYAQYQIQLHVQYQLEYERNAY